MKLLLVTEASAMGVGRHVLDLIEGLLRYPNMSIGLLYATHRSSAHFRRKAAELLGHPTFSVPGFTYHRGAVVSSGAQPYDIVHFHSSYAGLLRLVPWRFFTGAKVVYTPHAVKTLDPTLSPPLRIGIGAIERFLANRATSLVIAVSQGEKAHLLRLGVQPHKIALIPNGIRLVAETKTLPRTPVRIGTVARCVRQKGIDRFIRIATHFNMQGTQATFLLVTDKDADQVRRHVGLDVLPRNLEVQISDKGAELIRSMDIFLLTSRYEGFAYTLLEAASLCVPVIATRVSGVEDVYAGCADDLIVDNSDDVSAMIAKINALIADPAYYRAVARRAMNAARRFTVDAMVADTERVYSRLLQHESGQR